MAINIIDWMQINDSLIISHNTFRVEKTTLSMKFKTSHGDFMYLDTTKSSIPKRDLFIIKMVKDYVKKLPPCPRVDRSKIKYVCTEIHRGKIIKDCIEIDISGAYWAIAYKLGIISDNIYERGLLVSKKARLAALGALAKNITHLYFDGRQWFCEYVEESPLKDFFFLAAKEISEIMTQLRYLTMGGFYFYWVDAIFIKKEYAELVGDYLTSLGFEYKSFLIDAIIPKEDETGKYLEIFSLDFNAKKTKTKNRVFYFDFNDFNNLEK